MKERASSFFASSSPSIQTSIDGVKEQVSAFLAELQLDMPIALVTSGGTSVPLEKNVVRFLENFSGGTRGATTAELLLQSGYAVIFLTRKNSLQPFTRKLVKSSIFEFLSGSMGDTTQLHNIFSQYKEVVGRLLTVPYETVFQYLHYLKDICTMLRSRGPNALIFLAAAVSDFYIPLEEMSEHKMGSRKSDSLTLVFQKVPKMLGYIKGLWCPKAFVVSFKLETDTQLLHKKANASLNAYHQDLVVANMLQTHREEVWFLLKGIPESQRITRVSPEIESDFIPRIMELHREFVQKN